MIEGNNKRWNHNNIARFLDMDIKFTKDIRNLWGCYDNSGKELIGHQYEKIYIYNDHFIMAERKVKVAYNYYNAYTLYNISGKRISKEDCFSIQHIGDNLFKYSKYLYGGGFGVFDSNGTEIIPDIYESLDYSDGHFGVTLNRHQGTLYADGSFKFDNTIRIANSKIAKEKFGIWRIYDDNGNELLSDQFVSVTRLNKKLVGVAIKKDKKIYHGIIDHNLNYVQPADYEDIIVKDGCIKVSYDGYWHQINDNGEIIPTTLQLSNNTQLISEKDKCYIKNPDGKIIKEYDFVSEESFKYGLAIVKKRIIPNFYSENRFIYKYGLIDSEGSLLLPVVYKHIKILNKHYLLASKGSGGGLINMRGKVLIPYSIILFSNHLEKELTHSFFVKMSTHVLNKYIKPGYIKKNKISLYNNFCKLRFDLKNGTTDFLYDDWKDLLDLENEDCGILSGTVVKIGYDTVFVNINKKKAGWLPLIKKQKLKVGDKIKVIIREFDWDRCRIVLSFIAHEGLSTCEQGE